MRILVTGSSGFVGQRVVEMASAKGWHCLAQVRKTVKKTAMKKTKNEQFEEHNDLDEKTVIEEIVVPTMDSATDWSNVFNELDSPSAFNGSDRPDAVNGIDCIVHCAARVHQMQESEAQALVAYHEVNTLGTLQLARQAANSGVKRFIFLSSIKVNGEFTDLGVPFSVNVSQAPSDPYAKSKYDAELGLKKIAAETGLEVVIIRPPLVYGPGVKANFQAMLSWVEKGIPLPLGAINNIRSLVFIDNLVDLILTAAVHRNAVNGTFLVSDDNDVSTTELLNSVAVAMEKPSRLLPIPMLWIQLAAKLVGKPQIAQRLCGSLQVDIGDTKQRLNWYPPVSFSDGILQTVNCFVRNGK